MPQVPRFETTRSHIAGIPVQQLAEQFGTPVYVYDAAQIVERIEDLRAFDGIRYAQKACSNLAILDLVRRHGVLVDAVSAGEIGRALAAGYRPVGDPPPIVYTADIFDRDTLDLVVRHGLHVNCGSPDMIDQLGERAPGSQITLRLNPGFRTRPQPENQYRRRAIEARHLARTTRRLPAARRPSRPVRQRIAHAHRLGNRPGTSGPGLRIARKGRARSRPLADHAQHRRRLADSVSCRPNLRRSGCLFPPLGCHAAAARRIVRAPAAVGNRAGPIPGGRKRLSGDGDSSHQANGPEHFLSGRRRFQ